MTTFSDWIDYLIDQDLTLISSHLAQHPEWAHQFTHSGVTGVTPLSLSSRLGYVDIAQLLVHSGVDLEQTDQRHRTALHSAAIHGQPHMVQFLIEQGASLSAQDEEGYTALHWAAYFNHFSSVQRLVEAGAHLNLKNRDQFTPLMLAIYKKNHDIVYFLVEKGSSLEERNSVGLNALQLARQVDPSIAEIIQFLMDKKKYLPSLQSPQTDSKPLRL